MSSYTLRAVAGSALVPLGARPVGALPLHGVDAYQRSRYEPVFVGRVSTADPDPVAVLHPNLLRPAGVSGYGGMSAVFRAADIDLVQTMVLQAGGTSQSFSARYQRAAEIVVPEGRKVRCHVGAPSERASRTESMLVTGGAEAYAALIDVPRDAVLHVVADASESDMVPVTLHFRLF